MQGEGGEEFDLLFKRVVKYRAKYPKMFLQIENERTALEVKALAEAKVVLEDDCSLNELKFLCNRTQELAAQVANIGNTGEKERRLRKVRQNHKDIQAFLALRQSA